jgi:hypothetical protein
MCSSSPPRDNSAEIARQQEAERQARIAEGQVKIDEQFVGFNDDFYNDYQTKYNDFYYPQVDDQYTDARKRLTLDLARTGNLTSSSGANKMGDLQEYYNDQRTGITNKGLNSLNEIRANIDSTKTQLYNDNRSAADPGSAAAAAASAASNLQPGVPDSPLANAFTSFFNNVGNGVGAYNQAGGTWGRKDNNSVQNYNTKPSNYEVKD